MFSIGIDVGGTTVKVAAIRDGQLVATARSGKYVRPDAAQCAAAIRAACRDIAGPVHQIGLCVPGILDDKKQRIINSANLPGLNNVELPELVRGAFGAGAPPPLIVNDTNAAAFDLYAARRFSGRLLVIAIGTGVGAAVLDDGRPLSIDGESPGHLGQFDVSLEGQDVIGPDGGRGSLEGYIGSAALERTYGPSAAEQIQPEDSAFRSLVRAIRICHAIYRPHHVCLAGGVGIRLARLIEPLKTAVDTELTNIARRDWTLGTGDSDFHAAAGAARMAAVS